MGFAFDTTDNSVDFPAEGKPTRPTSAKTFNSNLRLRISPGSPFSDNSGAGLAGVAKWMLPRPPRPPLATTSSCPFSSKSANTSPVSASLTVVPCGTLIYRSSADAPVIPFVPPLPPGCALKWRLYRKSINVRRPSSTLKMIDPP